MPLLTNRQIPELSRNLIRTSLLPANRSRIPTAALKNLNDPYRETAGICLLVFYVPAVCGRNNSLLCLRR